LVGDRSGARKPGTIEDFIRSLDHRSPGKDKAVVELFSGLGGPVLLWPDVPSGYAFRRPRSATLSSLAHVVCVPPMVMCGVAAAGVGEPQRTCPSIQRGSTETLYLGLPRRRLVGSFQSIAGPQLSAPASRCGPAMLIGPGLAAESDEGSRSSGGSGGQRTSRCRVSEAMIER
jgi:hypothetical protein